MANETAQRMYCSNCKEVTEHVKISPADVDAMKNINEIFFKKHPEHISYGVYKAYPNWLKNVVFRMGGVVASVANGASNYYTGKDFASLWICSTCKHHQSRMFE